MGIESLIGAGIGLVGNLISSDNQASAVEDASATQAASSAAAIAEQRRQFDLTRGDYQPYRDVGQRALGTVESEIWRMPTPQEVMSQPGYQFGLQQGQQALDRKAAAAGGRVSGAALKAATEYGNNYATTGYNAEYQRRQDRLNRLQALAGIGQTATASSAAAGQNSANAISGLLSNQGDAAAAGQLARGNIWGNAVNQIGAYGQRAMSQNPYPSNGYNGGYSLSGALQTLDNPDIDYG